MIEHRYVVAAVSGYRVEYPSGWSEKRCLPSRDAAHEFLKKQGYISMTDKSGDHWYKITNEENK